MPRGESGIVFTTIALIVIVFFGGFIAIVVAVKLRQLWRASPISRSRSTTIPPIRRNPVSFRAIPPSCFRWLRRLSRRGPPGFSQ